MVTANKATRAAKGKGKGKGKAVPKVVEPTPSPSPEPEVEEDEEISDEEDSDDDGVDEAGMQRLMELVRPEDLDDVERSQLGMDVDEDEDEDEDEEGDDADEDDEDAPEEGDEEDDDVVIDEADADALAVDELGSEVSLDEDAVPERKVTTNNKPAMRILTEGIKMTHTEWPEHLIVQSKTVLDVDPDDDLKREMAFYKLALDAVPEARKLCSKYDILFSRPNDYYAEMVKSDEHMERVRTKLVEESQGIKKSEEAKKQRDLKKYGKQIQVEKLKQREADKRNFNDKVAGIKRKRKDGAEIGGGEDEFGIEIDNDDEPRRQGKGGKAGGKSKMPRQARDAKYSLGGGGKRSKQNTRESANDIPGWGGGDKKGKGGKGGAPGKAQRPGKARRHSRRK
ncbi:hypothetical protein CspeluHIS016_0202470 [Cutaneotrichosporon spelunceum]|uniref:Ebp2-domain-containing protein n=1 Tax=Cutaneotrichosporon spelunceum TaxID=1672016 RepID=A0AAD3Y9S1_9TREE|nr:hypothetical protein CspeluHIS016_0202470 [Cutaneotrichosporon spelunceum]